MRPEVEELSRANPIGDEEGQTWATSNAGQEVKQRAIEQSAVITLTPDPSRRRLTPVTAFVAGVFVVALVATPVLFAFPGGSDDVASLTAERILADGVVTEDEVRAAGEAVEQCMRDQGVSGSFRLEDDSDQGIFSHHGIQFDVPAGKEDILNDCIAEHMGGQSVVDGVSKVGHIWNAQNQPTPAELSDFNTKVVQCVEDWTGKDFGDMTQDETGAITAQGEATMSRATSEAGAEYQSCLYKVSASERQGFPPSPILFSDDNGLLKVPPGWMATHMELTPHDDSMDELIAVSTHKLQPGEACAGLAIRALKDLPTADLLVTVSEVETARDETPRPGSFSTVIDGIDPGTAVYTCLSRETRERFSILDTIVFTEEQRTFSVLVAVGSDVTEEQRGKVIDMLDSIELVDN